MNKAHAEAKEAAKAAAEMKRDLAIAAFRRIHESHLQWMPPRPETDSVKEYEAWCARVKSMMDARLEDMVREAAKETGYYAPALARTLYYGGWVTRLAVIA